jgi:hypothetical protein
MLKNLLKTLGQNRVAVAGSFLPKGSSAPEAVDGRGFSVARASQGVYTLTFNDLYAELISCLVGVRDAAGTATMVQAGDYSAANKTLQIRTFQGSSASASVKQLEVDMMGIRPTVRQKVMELHQPRLGATPPTQDTTRNGLAFDADAETVDWSIRVPSDWDGASDIILRLHYHCESGDAAADTETIIWATTINSIAAGEAVDAGTEQTPGVTYTQSGAGTDKELLSSDITIDYNSGDQPLAAGDLLHITLNRNVTGDTYSGDAVLLFAELVYYTAFPSVVPSDSLADGPYLARENGATDPTMKLVWPAGDVTPIQLPPIKLPDDLNSDVDVTVRVQAKSSSTNDTPTLTVEAFEGIGDTDFGGASGALSDSLAEVSVALANADIAGGTVLNLTLTPGAHNTDNVEIYSIAVEYTCGDTTSVAMALADLSDDADNVVNFLCVFRTNSIV